MQHWAFEIAKQVIEHNPNKDEYVCAAGISPSGSVHIGNFRDIITSYFVVKALQSLGKKAKLIFSWDDFDRLRKVPLNIQGVTQSFEENIGRPLTFISDPHKENASYGEYFEREFEESLKILGAEPDKYLYQTKEYMSGRYLDLIKHSIEYRKQIYDIIMEFKTQDSNVEERENYYPITIYCDKSLKDNTKIIKYDKASGQLDFFCRDCNVLHSVNINSYKFIKLVWKVDWPMRWLAEKVDFEPGGIDHASTGGSFDVSKEISRRIFKFEPPVFKGYGWLGIRGLGNMHSSTGKNITPGQVLKIYEPEVIKWLFAKYKPEDGFDFAFDETVFRHYSEFDKALVSYINDETNEYDSAVFDFCLPDKKKTKTKTAFSHIATIAPIVDFNENLTKKSLNKAGFEFEPHSFSRLKLTKNWIEIYNPDKKYVLLEQFNNEFYDTLSEEEKNAISAIYDFIENNNFTEQEIQQKLYSIINDSNLSKKENIARQKTYFKNFYNMLFGKDDGPRLYLYLAAANKENYLKLLKQ
ncbi:MAG: lysine--tRNA ligase [Clostridia bacterium]|jgi:lysyl-tRNA synthetase class 1|nr:lysine--tRNA ligase [Clostridia bacterium]